MKYLLGVAALCLPTVSYAATITVFDDASAFEAAASVSAIESFDGVSRDMSFRDQSVAVGGFVLRSDNANAGNIVDVASFAPGGNNIDATPYVRVQL